jgi:hypothetical protein
MICLVIYPCVPLYTSIPWRVPIWTAFLVAKTDVVYVTSIYWGPIYCTLEKCNVPNPIRSQDLLHCKPPLYHLSYRRSPLMQLAEVIMNLLRFHLDSLSGRENWCSVCNLREDMWRECFLCDAGQTWQSLWFSFVNPCCYGNIIFSLSFHSEKYFQKVTWSKLHCTYCIIGGATVSMLASSRSWIHKSQPPDRLNQRL